MKGLFIELRIKTVSYRIYKLNNYVIHDCNTIALLTGPCTLLIVLIPREQSHARYFKKKSRKKLLDIGLLLDHSV